MSRSHGRVSVLWPLLALVSAVAFAVGLFWGGSASDAASPSNVEQRWALSDVAGLPQPVKPAFAPDTPRFLQGGRYVARWALVRRPTAAHARPNTRARVVARLDTETPEGTSNIVLALGTRLDAAGALWVRVRLPILGMPNIGWVRREALGGYGTVTTRLVVDLDSFRATLFRGGQVVFRAPIGVGKPSWPTPRGEFYVRNKLTRFASPMYGPLAFGTSARSRILTDWPAGGFVGIHGTDQPELLPGRISHGCIRLRNVDILKLARLMPVGTPLTIR